MSDPASRTPDRESPDEETPFERFEDVLRKVVSVPKSEVDKKRRERRHGHL